MKKFKIQIPNFLGGFAPAWYLDSYPSYGNKNMAGDMQNVDLFNPASITQGPSLEALINPTGAAADILITNILDSAISANITYCMGGTYIYELSGTAPTLTTAAAPFWPHTISGAGVTGEDLVYYRGGLYYSYNAGASANVGMYDLTRDAETDFNDEYATTRGTVSISAGVPLPLEVGGNDFMYLGNKNRVSDWDATTWTNDALDLPTNCEIQDIKWNENRLWIAANQPDLTGSNKVLGSIYVWDGVQDSWEDEIRIRGRIGGMFVDNGILCLFYQDITNTGGYKLGFLNGRQIQELCSFPGSLPNYSQITKYKNFIIWVSGTGIYAFGAIDKNLPSMLFHYTNLDCPVGALSTPFGVPLVGYDDYGICKLSEEPTAQQAYWKSLMFPVGKCVLKNLIVYCDTLASEARIQFTITTDRGTGNYTTGLTLENTTVRRYKMPLGINVDNDFRVEISWEGEGATKINRIEIIGDIPED